VVPESYRGILRIPNPVFSALPVTCILQLSQLSHVLSQLKLPLPGLPKPAWHRLSPGPQQIRPLLVEFVAIVKYGIEP